jgi:hypothetical protein
MKAFDLSGKIMRNNVRYNRGMGRPDDLCGTAVILAGPLDSLIACQVSDADGGPTA